DNLQIRPLAEGGTYKSAKRFVILYYQYSEFRNAAPTFPKSGLVWDGGRPSRLLGYHKRYIVSVTSFGRRLSSQFETEHLFFHGPDLLKTGAESANMHSSWCRPHRRSRLSIGILPLRSTSCHLADLAFLSLTIIDLWP